ncbi:hypothetical protein LTR53_014714 [Teratosphaeriaceae sp. CCFEE 6253]|nr:hypothetical protein LTR53_014714 [Teratosphaeriaceae sp. CCFEE 6253]
MSKTYEGGDEALPLRDLRRRASEDSTGSGDLEQLLEASEDESETSSITLPPVNRGRGAWSCLLGCWLVEAMIWGFPLAFGVFQRSYSSNDLFKDSSNIATIGTLDAGIAYLGMPLVNPVALRWPQHRRAMAVFGWVLCLVGLIGASFATNVTHLLLSQGLLYGVGWVICYTPQLFIINEWFVDKRGLAYGILFGASGVTGLVIPVTIDWLLERYGFRTALRVYAIAIVVLSGPGLFLIHPRMPVSNHAKTATRNRDHTVLRTMRSFATSLHFLIMAAAIFVQGLGFFLPNIYIPSYADALGLSTTAGSSLLAWVSLSQVAGQLWQGWVSDKVNIYIPLSISALIPGLSTLLLWGPAKGMTYLIPFALIWGFFSASYSVLFTRVCSFLTEQHRWGQDHDDISMLLYGFFNFERGVSLLMEGPLSSWLIGQDRPIDGNRYGLGRYASVIEFTVLSLLSALGGSGERRSELEVSAYQDLMPIEHA